MKKLFCIFTVLVLLVGAAGCNNLYKHYDAETYAKQMAEPAKGDTMAKFHTSMGDITVKLFPKEAPKAVENFTTHAKEGYYDGMLFFRVLEDYFIQSGDPENSGKGGESIWGKAFADELCPYLTPYTGALCMANTGADTNQSQFFFVSRNEKDVFDYKQWNLDAPKSYRVDDAKLAMYEKYGGAFYLDYQISKLRALKFPDNYQQFKHTVFGQTVEGLDVVEAISHVKTCGEKEITEARILYGEDQTVALENKPIQDVVVNSIEIYTFGN